MPSPLTRRALLVTAAVGVTAACTSPSSPPPPPPRPTADQLARAAAAARETELHGLAAAALDAYPTLVGARQTYSFTAAHAQALAETLVPSPTASGSSRSVRQSAASHSSAGASTAASRTQATLPPGTRAATARSLAAALLDAAGAHRAASTGVSADLARLLASVAASDSALAVKLTRAAG